MVLKVREAMGRLFFMSLGLESAGVGSVMRSLAVSSRSIEPYRGKKRGPYSQADGVEFLSTPKAKTELRCSQLSFWSG
jgi:hypothetical protein